MGRANDLPKIQFSQVMAHKISEESDSASSTPGKDFRLCHEQGHKLQPAEGRWGSGRAS